LDQQHGLSARLQLERRAPHMAAALFLLVTLLAPLLNGCGDEMPLDFAGPADESSSRDAPRSLVPQAGRMHNLILEKTLAALPELTTKAPGNVSHAELREAFRDAARQAFRNQPNEQLEVLLDDAHLDLIEARFYQLKSLLTRSEPPSSEELETLFRSWGVDGENAGRAASFSLLASAAGGAKSAAETSTPSASKQMGLRELGHSSPTLAMIYEVYQASTRFWQGVAEEDTLQREGSFKEEKWEICLTIVMDAEGALGGLLFGPIGSILASAAYSVLWAATEP